MRNAMFHFRRGGRRRSPVLLVIGLSLLAGCGERGGQHLEQARVAASNQRHELTIEKASAALAEDPGNVEALRLKAEAELAMGRLAQARQSLTAAAEVEPDHLPTRDLFTRWAVRMASATLEKTGFLDSPELQQTFEETVSLGRQQVERMRDLAPASHEWRLASARLTGVELERGELELARLRRSPELMSDQAGVRGRARREVAERIARNDALRDQISDHLDTVARAQADHPEAVERYAQLLVERQRWSDLWLLAGRTTTAATLAPEAAAALATGLLQTPDVERPVDQRIAMARTLLNLVPTERQTELDWQIAMIQSRHAGGEWSQALPELEALRKAHKESPQVHFLYAQNAFGRREYATAARVCEELATRYLSPAVQTLYARSLARIGKPELGIAELRRAIEAYPDDSGARQALIGLLAEAGFLAEAQNDIAEFYRREPNSPAAIQLALQYYQAMGDRDEALRVLRELETVEPRTLDHLRLLVEACLELQEHDKAVQYAQELTAQRPELLVEQMRLLGALLAAGQVDAAQQLAAQIRHKHQDVAGLEAAIARLYLRHQPEAGVPMLEAAVARQPHDSALRLMLAQSLATRGEVDQALERVSAVLTADPTNTEAHVLAWRLNRIAGNLDAAAMHLGQIDPQALDPRSGAAVIAQIHLSEGRPEQAIAVCNAALLGGSNDPALRMTLAQLYEARGNQRMVEAHLAGLVNADPANPGSWQMLCRHFMISRDVSRGMDVLSTLAPANPALAAWAKAQLLISMQQQETAVLVLEPVFAQLLAKRDPMTLMVADVLAQAHRRARARSAAATVYTQMINAGVDVPRATLRRIDLNHTDADPQPTIDALVALAEGTPDLPTDLRIDVARRLAALRQFDAALRLLDQWVMNGRDASALLVVRGQVLIDARRPEDAIASFQRAVELAPQDIEYRLRLGWAYQELADAPAAEAAFKELASLGQRGRIAASRQLVTHYARQGLVKPTIAAFEELEQIEPLTDPALLLLAGRTYKIAGDLDRAAAVLERIARRSSAYAAAQVELARIELERTRADQARQRLTAVTNDAETAPAAVAALLSFDRNDPLTLKMHDWCEGYLDPRRLPANLEIAWLRSRVAAYSHTEHFEVLLESITRLCALEPEAWEHPAARVALLLAVDRIEDAQVAFDGSGAFKDTPRGRLLSLVLAKLPPDQPASTEGMHGMLEAILRQDPAAAREAAQSLELLRTVYRTDMLTMLADDKVLDSRHGWYWRNLVVAAVALEANLPGVTESLALKLAQSATAPESVLACGLYAQAMLSQNKPTQRAFELAQQRCPQTLLARYLTARQAAETNDHLAAIKECQTLLAAEPNHAYVQVMLAGSLRKTHDLNRAVEVLDALAGSDNPMRVPATVELAEILIERGGPSLGHAAQVVMEATQKPGVTAGLVATLGWLEHLAGQDQEARGHLNRALLALRDRPIMHYRLGVVYLGLGQHAWARMHLEQAASAPVKSAVTDDARKLLATVQTPNRG